MKGLWANTGLVSETESFVKEWTSKLRHLRGERNCYPEEEERGLIQAEGLDMFKGSANNAV